MQDVFARPREFMINENVCFVSIYDILKDRILPTERKPTLNHPKVKIVRLNSKQHQSITIDVH
jgi:hypothetical protein